MEAIFDAHFTDRSPTGLIRLSDNGEVAETYFDVLVRLYAQSTLSHLSTIRKAYFENHEMVMIMEDDVSPALM